MNNTTPDMKPAVPILRMFDIDKTKQFYLEFLEFRLDWEHRFEEGLPLYMQISCGGCVLHLSEHFGDCSPGAAIRIETTHVEALHSRLLAKQYKYARPGLETAPWGSKEIRLTDPSGNRIVIYENVN
ncbi:glyoxalase superfamily protein [Paenibacillus sp. NPDC056579]|uniref:glyoxalase superfamily protein n=1 Tax=Paenibacillus sp. NPDC056579 TaxID=3345871 RepID=UPI0036946C93